MSKWIPIHLWHIRLTYLCAERFLVGHSDSSSSPYSYQGRVEGLECTVFPYVSKKIQTLDRLIRDYHIVTDFFRSRLPRDLGIHHPQVPSALIYADIDELKAVNDELSHDTVDRLIQDAGRILQASFRDSDVVARLGGDEFAAFTLDAAQPEAIMARIQSNIESFCLRSSLPYLISLSIGIVQCNPSSDLTISDYLSLEDKQMYEQKNKSRSKPDINT